MRARLYELATAYASSALLVVACCGVDGLEADEEAYTHSSFGDGIGGGPGVGIMDGLGRERALSASMARSARSTAASASAPVQSSPISPVVKNWWNWVACALSGSTFCTPN